MISGVSYLIRRLRTIPILCKHIRSSLACSWFLSLRTVSYFLNLLSVHYSIFHSSPSILLSLLFSTHNPSLNKAHCISFSLKHQPFQTVKLIAFRHAQATIWHGAPVPSSTTVPPLAAKNCLFSCVLGVSYLGSFISLRTYINFGMRASSDSHLNPTLFLA